MSLPILYSFRRCPYAMRARLALRIAGIRVELREILLREKAPEFLAISVDKTVPLLSAPGIHFEHSYDIMKWALAQNDPDGWLDRHDPDLIAECDGPFKAALDHYKYSSRFPDQDALDHREAAGRFLWKLEDRLAQGNLSGTQIGLSDAAIVTFARQFRGVDADWFDAQEWHRLKHWLNRFLASPELAAIMHKYPKWQAGDAPTYFPEAP